LSSSVVLAVSPMPSGCAYVRSVMMGVLNGREHVRRCHDRNRKEWPVNNASTASGALVSAMPPSAVRSGLDNLRSATI
jgi:hypothetical protein